MRAPAMRALGALALLALVAGGALAMVAARLVDPRAVRTGLEELVRARTGAELRLRAVDVGWLPPRLVLESPSLVAPGDPDAPLLAADAVVLSVSAPSLLRGAPPLSAVRHIVVSGDAVRGEGAVAADGRFELALALDGVAAAALAPVVASLRLGRGDAPELRVSAGRIGGTLRLSGAPDGALRVDASLVLDGADLEVEGAALEGRVGLVLALTVAPDSPWAGSFDADLEGARVERGVVRKERGRPTRVTGRLVPRADGGGVAVTELRVAPLALDLRLGADLPDVSAPPIPLPPGGAKAAAETR